MENGPRWMPGSETCYVEDDKVKNYLLNEGHPRGAGKARFFVGFEFTNAERRVFVMALRAHGAAGDLAGSSLTVTGNVQYEVDGKLETTSSRSPSIRTVWERQSGMDPYPEGLRLVTAFPAAKNTTRNKTRR